MKGSIEGGESLFSDGFRAAQIMRVDDEERFNNLREFHIEYHYSNNGHSFTRSRPTVEMNKAGRIKVVNWSPPFQSPSQFAKLGFAPQDREDQHLEFRRYLAAAQTFKTLIEDQDAVFETKMEEGTCVVFDNRRILHARRAFDGQQGERWLRGAYVDTDCFKGRLETLGKEFGIPSPLGHEWYKTLVQGVLRRRP